MKNRIKKLPDSELEIMLIIWHANEIVTRSFIEKKLGAKKLASTTILSFLSRLEEKGFVKVERVGKSNNYYPIINEDYYLQNEAKTFIEKLYGNSIKKFVTSLYNGNEISAEQLEDLRNYLNDKISKED